MYITKEDQPMS